MRQRSTPIGWPRRDPRHYRFAMPNAVWEYKLKPVEFVIFSCLCYHCASGALTSEMIAANVKATNGLLTFEQKAREQLDDGTGDDQWPD